MSNQSKTFKKKYFFIFIFLIELLLTIIAISKYKNRESVNIYYSQEDLLYSTGEEGFYIDTSYEGIKITSPEFTLPKGMYTIKIKYDYAGSVKMNVSYVDGRLLSNISGDIPASSENEIQCDFKVRYEDRPMQVCGIMRMDAGNSDYLLIREIVIEDSPTAILNFGFRLVLFFLFINALVSIMFYRKKWNISKENQAVGKSLLILILFTSLPLMVDYLPWSGHDLAFHLMRIEGLKSGLQSGMFPVKIQPNWLHGHGYAVSVFYGDFFLYIPAILRLFGVSIQSAYQFYVLLVNTATVFIAYWCFSKMSTKKIGVICAAVYVLNIYRLTCLYTRAAVGEYTAMAFFPMILYGFWSVYHFSEESKEHKKSWIWIIFGCSGVLLSHLISCEMVAVFVILTCIIFWRKTFRRKTFLVLVKSAICIVLLNLWFLVPFLDYMMNGTYIINAPGNWVAFRIDERGSFLAQLFVNSYNVTSSSFGHEIGMAGEMPQTLGAASLILLCVWFLFYMGRKDTDAKLKRSERICVCFLIFSLLLSTYLIPYTTLAEWIPALKFPERSIQYVWRFLALAGLFMAWLACIILQNETIAQKKRAFITAAVIGVAFWQSLSMMSDVLNKNSPLRIYQEGNLTTCEVSGGEYLPVDYELSDYVNNLTYDDAYVSVVTWERDGNQILVEADNKASETQQLEVPFLYYKGYVAKDETGNQLQITSGTSGRVSISLPAGYQGSLCVEFKEPWYWRICEIISLLFLFAICVTLIKQRKEHIHFGQKTSVLPSQNPT